MADHLAMMTGRLLTEASLRTAIHDEAFAEVDVPSTTAGYEQPQPDRSSVPDGVQLGVGKAESGVMVECRICQEEGDEAYMETPCTCKGSLKYAHHRCVQRWCNEKGDTTCEICLQQFTPNYTAPLKLFRHGRNPTNLRGSGEIPENRVASYGHNTDQAGGASSFDSQSSNPKSIIYSRVVAISLMALLLLRDTFSVILRSTEVCSINLITLLMFRTAGIVIPVYIILISVTTLLYRCNQRQQPVHEMPVREPGGPRGSQSMPLQQHIIGIR